MTFRTRFQHRTTQISLALAVLTVAAMVTQILFAGLALFDSASRWTDHRTFGMMIGPLVFLLVLAILLSRPSRALAGMSVALLVLYIAQINLPSASPGWIAALHPLAGFTILALPVHLALGLGRAIRGHPAEMADASLKATGAPSPASAK